MISGVFAFVAGVVSPMILGSNIWPIAAAIWSVLTVPLGVGVGAVTGFVVRNSGRTTANAVMIVTGNVLATVVVVLIVKNPY